MTVVCVTSLRVLLSFSFCHFTCPFAHRSQGQAPNENGTLDRRTWGGSREGVSMAACLCFHAGTDRRVLAVSPTPHVPGKEQTFWPPSAPVDALPRELAQGSSLENCSLPVRAWTGLGPGAIITRWRGLAADRGLYPVCSLFQLNRSGQDRMFPLTPALPPPGGQPEGLDGANGQCHAVTWHQHQLVGGALLPWLWAESLGRFPQSLTIAAPIFPFCPLSFHPGTTQIPSYHGPLTGVTSPFLPQLPTLPFLTNNI